MIENNSTESNLVGRGEFVYQANDAWHSVPDGMPMGEAVGVATDSRDRVYVFTRGDQPVMIFDRDGNFLQSWGTAGGISGHRADDEFVRPHGIWIGPDDSVYLSDDRDHTVRKFTTDGKLLFTLGTSGQGSDSGVENASYLTIKRPAPPFNLPTNLALSPDGEMYVSDGYGNCCIHKFSPDGELLLSWGAPGDGPGEFQIPHGVAVDHSGIVVVADRENSRLQWFTSDGVLIEEWTNVARPCNVFFDEQDNVFVAELGWHAGTPNPRPDEPGGRVSIFSRSGELLSRWGGGKNPYAPGDFAAPHDIWLDSHGDIYVGEVTISAAVARGLVSEDCPSLQKFVKQ